MKKYNFFKVKYSHYPAEVIEFKSPITKKEAQERYNKYYGNNSGFCVPVPDNLLLEVLKTGLYLFEVKKDKVTGIEYIKRFVLKSTL
jgi:hypothetical protein